VRFDVITMYSAASSHAGEQIVDWREWDRVSPLARDKPHLRPCQVVRVQEALQEDEIEPTLEFVPDLLQVANLFEA
jgi:hypothetical protein